MVELKSIIATGNIIPGY